jgi:hypothetical protein
MNMMDIGKPIWAVKTSAKKYPKAAAEGITDNLGTT